MYATLEVSGSSRGRPSSILLLFCSSLFGIIQLIQLSLQFLRATAYNADRPSVCLSAHTRSLGGYNDVIFIWFSDKKLFKLATPQNSQMTDCTHLLYNSITRHAEIGLLGYSLIRDSCRSVQPIIVTVIASVARCCLPGLWQVHILTVST